MNKILELADKWSSRFVTPHYPGRHKALVEIFTEHEKELREQAELFSEAAAKVDTMLEKWGTLLDHPLRQTLAPFIISVPDPLESWLHKSGYEGNSVVEQALADLTKSGGKIVWEAGE